MGTVTGQAAGFYFLMDMASVPGGEAVHDIGMGRCASKFSHENIIVIDR